MNSSSGDLQEVLLNSPQLKRFEFFTASMSGQDEKSSLECLQGYLDSLTQLEIFSLVNRVLDGEGFSTKLFAEI